MEAADVDGRGSDRFEGLTPQERFACVIAERVLGAVATPSDVHGRQGAVDAILNLPNGRSAAFEVTALAGPGALQTVALLGRNDWLWPPAGEWWWSIRVGSPQDIPRLEATYVQIAWLCEAAGIADPRVLHRHNGHSDADVEWLVEQSSSDMVGHPGVATVDATGRHRGTTVLPPPRGGGSNTSLTGLTQALSEAFAQDPMPRHFAKLARADADERHLFVPVHSSALPFPVALGLMEGVDLPPQLPPIPISVTHLWLAPQFARRILLWSPSGWSQHYPYDN